MTKMKYQSKCVGAHSGHHLHKTISWHYWGGNIYDGTPADIVPKLKPPNQKKEDVNT